MESSPSYSPEDRDNRGRSGKERSYQPPAPESMFVDPRPQEAPRAPISAPLEGVIHIRPVSEAVFGYMQQQAELADPDKDNDKDDKRDKGRAPVPLPASQPVVPAEEQQTAEPAPDTDIAIWHEEDEPADTEQATDQDQDVQPGPDPDAVPDHMSPAPYYAEQLPTDQPDVANQVTGGERPLNDGVQRAWYYTPPHGPNQQAPEAPPPPPDYWQTAPTPAAQPAAEHTQDSQPVAVLQPAEAVASPDAPIEDEPAVWHYDTDPTPAFVPDQVEPAPAPYAGYETPQDIEPPTPAVNPLFGARVPDPAYPYAAAGMPPFGGGGDGPRPPYNPFEGGYASPEPAPSERYGYAAPALSPSRRLERLLPVQHEHSHRSLALGIFGGLLLEHALSKGRDNKLSERINKLQQESNAVQGQTYWANQELRQTQQTLRIEQQRMQEEIARPGTPAVPESRSYVPTAETRADVSGTPVYAAAGVATAAMAPNRSPARPEQRPVAVPQQEQQLAQDPNQQPEYVDQNGNPIRLRPGEHIRHSEWHSYVEKDGQLVDAIAYGRALHEEQQQELGHVPQFDNNSQSGAASGQAFGTDQGMYGAVNPSLPSGMTTPTLPTGQSTHADSQHQLPGHTKSGHQVASNFANPWFWLMLALIFAAFFISMTV